MNNNNYIFQRRNAEYTANEKRWKRSGEAYSGGREYIEQALIRHVSEINLEFSERRSRAYYFNYPRAIARRITQYALSIDPIRRNADPELVEDWSRTGLRTNDVMRQLSTLLNVYGRAWLQVEMPLFDGNPSRQPPCGHPPVLCQCENFDRHGYHAQSSAEPFREKIALALQQGGKLLSLQQFL